MSGATHAQARVLRRHLAATLVRWSALYTAAVAAFAFAWALVLGDLVGNAIINATSHPTTMTAGEAADYIHANESSFTHFDVTPTTDENIVVVRDFGVYYLVQWLALPVGIGVVLLGYIGLVATVLRRAVGYFEELSDAVAGLMQHREEPVRLSSALSIVQDELNDIRTAALADERAAAEAERRKNELVAYLAHDIRTPLTSVIGYLSLLDEAPDLPDEQRRRYTATALAKAETLDTLTAEFFEITRYNLSSIPIEREDVDVRLFLDQIADEFLPELQARSLTAEVDAPLGKTLRVDPEKMARVLGNVMRNALTHALAGTTIRLAAAQPDPAHWQLTITDQGREIAPEHLERIFERFYRADEARASTGNAGLGLAIAREIVEAHGGTIRAESVGGTTTFVIELPG